MIGALILVVIVTALVGCACWTGRKPNTQGEQAQDTTGVTRVGPGP